MERIEKYRKTKDRDRQINTIDPRIDSPDVKVIYPSPVEEQFKTDIPKGKADKVLEEPTLPPKEQPKEKQEAHVCKVDIQEAIKQNFVGFFVLVVLAVGTGYLIGKK